MNGRKIKTNEHFTVLLFTTKVKIGPVLDKYL